MLLVAVWLVAKAVATTLTDGGCLVDITHRIHVVTSLFPDYRPIVWRSKGQEHCSLTIKCYVWLHLFMLTHTSKYKQIKYSVSETKTCKPLALASLMMMSFVSSDSDGGVLHALKEQLSG